MQGYQKPKSSDAKIHYQRTNKLFQKVETTLEVQSICKQYTSKGQIHMSKDENNLKSFDPMVNSS